MRGTVLARGDPGYDDARRVQNGLIDRYPAYIVRCRGTADVVEAVNFARSHRLDLSIRGGGHNIAGTAVNDDGLVIDLSGMRAVHVDPIAETVRADGGATWSDVDRESQLFGLAVPGGVVSTTGVGGLTLHGGLGHLRRKYGLSIDNVIEIEIVAADGQVLMANETSHPDLFWAVRGGGGNFGVVTSFLFKAHPVGPMLQLVAPMYALHDAPQVLCGWLDYVQDAPDEVTSLAVLWSVPDVDGFPPELRRQPIVLLGAVHAGSADDGARVMQPLRELATPLLDLSAVEPYTQIQTGFDPFFPKGRMYYWKSCYVDTLTDEAITTMVDYARNRPSELNRITFWHLGGAMGSVPADATAYWRRDAPYLFASEADWDDPADSETNIAWAREALAAMQGFSRGGLYLNFAGFGEEKQAMLRATFGDNYERLVDVKTRYDPDNLFHINQNIPPRTGQ